MPVVYCPVTCSLELIAAVVMCTSGPACHKGWPLILTRSVRSCALSPPGHKAPCSRESRFRRMATMSWLPHLWTMVGVPLRGYLLRDQQMGTRGRPRLCILERRVLRTWRLCWEGVKGGVPATQARAERGEGKGGHGVLLLTAMTVLPGTMIGDHMKHCSSLPRGKKTTPPPPPNPYCFGRVGRCGVGGKDLGGPNLWWPLRVIFDSRRNPFR